MSVLDKFVVVNRKNMYVFKESGGDNVFYMRLVDWFYTLHYVTL